MARREWLEAVRLDAWGPKWNDPIPLHDKEWYADLLINGDAQATPMPVIVLHPCRCNDCKEKTKDRRGDGSDEPQWPSFES